MLPLNCMLLPELANCGSNGERLFREFVLVRLTGLLASSLFDVGSMKRNYKINDHMNIKLN